VCVFVTMSCSVRELVREREQEREREGVREGAGGERESDPSAHLPALLLAERGFLEVRRVRVRKDERLWDARLGGCDKCAGVRLQDAVHLGGQREGERQGVSLPKHATAPETQFLFPSWRGGSGGHVHGAERVKHAVGVCDDGAGARGGGDAGT
jgi:hypothetical protein